MADEDGPGALEAMERLEGSPPPEHALHPHQEQIQGEQTIFSSKQERDAGPLGLLYFFFSAVL